MVLALGTPAPDAAAQRVAREGGGLQRRPASTILPATRLTPTAREALRRWLCPNGGAPARGAPGRCDGLRREAREAAAPNEGGDAAGWFRGLPPARGRQAACPEGFKAALARGHDDVTRCLPG